MTNRRKTVNDRCKNTFWILNTTITWKLASIVLPGFFALNSSCNGRRDERSFQLPEDFINLCFLNNEWRKAVHQASPWNWHPSCERAAWFIIQIMKGFMLWIRLSSPEAFLWLSVMRTGCSLSFLMFSCRFFLAIVDYCSGGSCYQPQIK